MPPADCRVRRSRRTVKKRADERPPLQAHRRNITADDRGNGGTPMAAFPTDGGKPGCAGMDTMYGVPTDGGNGWGRTPCMVSLLF